VSIWKNKNLFAVMIGGLWTVIFIVLILLNSLGIWQLKLSNLLYGNSGGPSKDIVIVGIDDNTIDPVNGLGDPATWSRSFYAKALENLNKYNPKVVVFDVLFRQARDNEGDLKFKTALEKTKNSVLAIRNAISDKKTNLDIVLPLELFRVEKNVFLAIWNTIADSDDAIRRYKSGEFDPNRNIFDDSIAFKAARLFNGDLLSNIPLADKTMLINYFSKVNDINGGYQYISFLDLYKDKFSFIDPNTLKDKIVLIGAFSRSMNDIQFTPLSSTYQMYGVEIHANAIQTILEGKFLRNFTVTEKILLVLILAFLASFVFMMTKIRWSILFLAGVPVVYSLLAPFGFSKGIIFDLVHPYLLLPAVFVSVYLYRYVTEIKARMKLKSNFAKYVSPAIVEQISANPEGVKLGGQKMEVTIMFTDIVGSTSISEKLKPENMVKLLNEYLDAMSKVVINEGGTLDKFEGDAIMAFFGAPLPQEDQAVRACKTAIKMRRRMVELQAEWDKALPLPGGEKYPEINFRCGINTGMVIVGNIGSSERFDYTVIGDDVNLCSRLEGANKEFSTGTMISEKTFIKTGDLFNCRWLACVRVLGKKESIKVFELRSERVKTDGADHLADEYNEGISLYYSRKFGEALNKFDSILKVFPDDGPSKYFRQKCDVFSNFPPPKDWDGVIDLTSK
jgi:adenylate cyclase